MDTTPPGAPSAPTPPTTSPLSEVEHWIERGFCAVHGQLSENFSTLFQIAATATGMVNLLVEKGVIDADEVTTAISDAGKRLEEGFGRSMRFEMYPGTEDKRTVTGTPVDCEARIPLCRAACCAFSVPMSAQDVEEGKLRLDLGKPYVMRRGPDGYCTHHNAANGGCGVYDDRPVICRAYSCADDKRIWLDFDKRIPNAEGIEFILSHGRSGRLRGMAERPRTEGPK